MRVNDKSAIKETKEWSKLVNSIYLKAKADDPEFLKEVDEIVQFMDSCDRLVVGTT